MESREARLGARRELLFRIMGLLIGNYEASTNGSHKSLGTEADKIAYYIRKKGRSKRVSDASQH